MSKETIIDTTKSPIDKKDNAKQINSISSIINLFKRYKLFKIIVGISSIATLIITIILLNSNVKIKNSYRDSIFHEINHARNMLDYTIQQRQQNIRTRPIFSLVYANYIPKSFVDKPSLKDDLNNLYRLLFSAQKSAEKLMDLLSQKNSNSLTIRNIENQIKQVIETTDKVGSQVAEHIGKPWQIPDSNISQQEKIKYYENKTWIFNSTSTDTNIKSSWQQNK